MISATDALRRGVQGGAAAALTLLACRAVGSVETSWAIVSALFVLQANADATMAAAAGRLAGTVLGSLIGLLVVLAFGGDQLILLRVAIAAALMSGVASAWPSVRYGVVAASIIALDPDPDVFGGALDRCLTILIGSGIGMATAFLVWPATATGRARRAIEDALRACRDLLAAEADRLTGGREQGFDPIHRRFLRHYRTARTLADNARLLPRDRRQALGDAVHALSQLWHSLVFIDRLASEPATRQLDTRAAAAVRDARRTIGETLDRLAGAKGEAAVDRAPGNRPVADLQKLAAERPGLELLSFALKEVVRNLDDEAAALQRFARQA